MAATQLGHMGDGVYLGHEHGQYTEWTKEKGHRNVVAYLEPHVLLNTIMTVVNNNENMKRLVKTLVE